MMKSLVTVIAFAVMLSATFAQNRIVVLNPSNQVVTGTDELIIFTNGITLGQTVLDTGGIITYEGDDAAQFRATQIDISKPLAFQSSEVAQGTRSSLGFSTNLNTLWTATSATNFQSALWTNGLILPTATNNTNAGSLYRVANQVRFRDSTNGERILLNNADNLSNLTSYATARTNLFSDGGVPSGAAPTNAFLRADGSGGSSFDTRAQIVRRMTNNGATITNVNTYTDDGVLQSTIGAGFWRVEGYTIYSTAQGSVQVRIQATNNMTAPRAFTVAVTSGGVSAGYNDATNIILVNDGGTGTRTFAFYGILNLTNTSTVKVQLASTAGTTNTNMVTMLSNSFLILTPVQ